MGLTSLAVVPARKGSKGLPGKNLRTVGGVPLVGRAVLAAIGSGVVDRVIVSTDCPEIAAVGVEFGAESPFLRPPELSTDEASSYDVVAHALEACGPAELVVLLQPTSPLRTADDVRLSYAALDPGAPASVSLVEAETHPWLVSALDADGFLVAFGDRPRGYLRRQDLPKVYRLNGAVYWIRSSVLIQGGGSFTPEGTKGYVMPAERSIDIDTAEDLELAEWMVTREVAV